MYRLLADIFNDSAMILDCLSPAFPKSSRVLILSFSSVLRALCGVAAGSSKASLSAHFATQGNLGELNAAKQKDFSQETVISLVGMLAGSLIVSHISSQWATWTAMIALLAIHLSTNYLAVKAVSMRTLNRQRANLVISNCLAQCPDSRTEKSSQSWKIKVPSPEMISLQERIFERDGVLRGSNGAVLGYCQLGVSLQTVFKSFGPSHGSTGSHMDDGNIRKLLKLFHEDAYILWYDRARNMYLVVFKHGCLPTVHVRAWAHAFMTAATKEVQARSSTESILRLLEVTKVRLNEFLKTTDLFSELENAGWDLETGAMETRSGTRCQLKE
ncbi:hypothetical protein BP5796_02663 [Coleophoma crateriformis]|uniref:Protein root UVB sensitive/RUS domain-containing protein n=1 Tax=Coleophoma crateriformis TaxID=565419 RepID=A0A3D8T0G4_9HELO|nr:hypothetical protein BP5796_02663 [Coleophoma crateriformis]